MVPNLVPSKTVSQFEFSSELDLIVNAKSSLAPQLTTPLTTVPFTIQLIVSNQPSLSLHLNVTKKNQTSNPPKKRVVTELSTVGKQQEQKTKRKLKRS